MDGRVDLGGLLHHNQLRYSVTMAQPIKYMGSSTPAHVPGPVLRTG
jgi:hypothetical protein